MADLTVKHKKTGLIRQMTKLSFQMNQKNYVVVQGDVPNSPPQLKEEKKAVEVVETSEQPVEIIQKVTGNGGTYQVPSVSIEEKPKRIRRTKAEMEAANNK